jgi:hypothetical protein
VVGTMGSSLQVVTNPAMLPPNNMTAAIIYIISAAAPFIFFIFAQPVALFWNRLLDQGEKKRA